MDRKGPLPPGYEAKWDYGQKAYFYINHNDKSTTWVDPRTTMSMAAPTHPRTPQKATTESDRNAAEMSTITQMFPDCPYEILESVMRSCQNNLESAKQQLKTLGFRAARTGQNVSPVHTSVKGKTSQPKQHRTPTKKPTQYSVTFGTGSTEYSTGRTDNSTGRTDNSTGRTDNSTGRTDNSTGRTDNSTGRTDNSTGRTDYGTGRTDHGTGRTDYGTGRTDYGTGRTDYGTGRTDYGTGRTDYGTGSTDHGTGSTDHGTGSTDHGTGATYTERTSNSHSQGTPQSGHMENSSGHTVTDTSLAQKLTDIISNIGVTSTSSSTGVTSSSQGNTSTSSAQGNTSTSSAGRTTDTRRANNNKKRSPVKTVNTINSNKDTPTSLSPTHKSMAIGPDRSLQSGPDASLRLSEHVAASGHDVSLADGPDSSRCVGSAGYLGVDPSLHSRARLLVTNI